MLELAKNGTPNYGNLEHREMNATVKAEGNVAKMNGKFHSPFNFTQTMRPGLTTTSRISTPR